jgi:hypothetical protein
VRAVSGEVEHGHGDHGHGTVVDPADLPEGANVTLSGRISVAEDYPANPPEPEPFTPQQLSRIDEAMMLASRSTGLRFNVYVGDLGEDPVARTGELHADVEGAAGAVLIAISPGQRFVEVLTGRDAKIRLPDRNAKLAIMSMVASFKEGDLVGGLLSGLRMLADQAGRHAPIQHVGVREQVVV